MEPVVVLLHPDLGEHLVDEVLVGLGTMLARLSFLPAIVPDEGDVADVLPKELDLRIRAGLNGALNSGQVRRLCSVREDLDMFGNLLIGRPAWEFVWLSLADGVPVGVAQGHCAADQEVADKGFPGLLDGILRDDLRTFPLGGLGGLQAPLHSVQVKDTFPVLNGHELAHLEDAAGKLVRFRRIELADDEDLRRAFGERRQYLRTQTSGEEHLTSASGERNARLPKKPQPSPSFHWLFGALESLLNPAQDGGHIDAPAAKLRKFDRIRDAGLLAKRQEHGLPVFGEDAFDGRTVAVPARAADERRRLRGLQEFEREVWCGGLIDNGGIEFRNGGPGHSGGYCVQVKRHIWGTICFRPSKEAHELCS